MRTEQDLARVGFLVMKENLKVYYDLKHPVGYASIRKLFKATGINEKKVKEWLKAQPTYTLHKQARKVYPTRYIALSMISTSSDRKTKLM